MYLLKSLFYYNKKILGGKIMGKERKEQGIHQRGSTYTIVVEGPRNNDGSRNQITKGGFRTKKEARVARIKLLNEINEGKYIVESEETFASFVPYWFKHYEKRVKASTASTRKYTVDKHLVNDNPFSNKPISKITTEDIDALYNLKLEQGLSASTVKRIHQLLNIALTQAVKWKRIKFNPAIDADPPPVNKEEMQIWSFKEIRAFLDKCNNSRYKILFLIAIYTGMRKGEILGLKWSDIDLKKKKIHVQRTLQLIAEEGYIFTTPKTKKSIRQIPIPEFLIEQLLIFQKEQENWKNRLGEEYQDQNLVICTEKGTIQDPRNILRKMKKICEEANVTPIRFHDIRHTHASILISEGVDLVKVSARLGHANAKITMEIYAHLIPNQDDDVADIFHNAMNQSL